MKSLLLEENLEAKSAYERFLNMGRVQLGGYHADNGLFADKGFVDACNINNQTLKFCAVGTHHQNGIA